MNDLIMPPYTCGDSNVGVMDVFIYKPDGTYHNVVRMNACDADWHCLYQGLNSPEGEGWYWVERTEDNPLPEEPPVDHESVDDVQSGN